MNIYERFGVKPIFNLCGYTTRFGGAPMEKEALQAMYEAAGYSVRLDELQAAASKVISEATNAEAGIVTSGAAGALTLGTAACICGYNVGKMNRLPDTTGIANEVIMPQHHISGYSHAIKAAGAKIIGVGIPNDTPAPDEIPPVSTHDLEAAINENTVAVAYAVRPGSNPPLQEVIEAGHKHNLPVLVDAAAQVPPVKNLCRFIDMGADLVCFSGGKGIRGPQASGILCGKKELISSAVLQMLDMAGVPYERWDPPRSLIPKEKLLGKPEHGIARSAKASKEAIIGLLVALQNLTEDKFLNDKEYYNGLLGIIGNYIKDIPSVTLSRSEDYQEGFPLLEVFIDEKKSAKNAFQVADILRRQGIYIRDNKLNQGCIAIHPVCLDEETAYFVAEKLFSIISK